MAFKKTAIHAADSLPVEFLNIPEGNQWEILNTSMIKTASIDKSAPLDLGGFDLEAAIKDKPEHLFVKVFAIKKDEVNDNGDSFSEAELKKAAHTFVGVPVFVNHQNDDIEKARGKVVHAWYDEKAGGIYIISRVDKVAYPKLARGIEEGTIVGSSMGCFPAHMRVLMADGTEKPIDQVKSGDEVISHTGKSCKVLNVQNHLDKTADDIFIIKAACLESSIEVTKEHPFLVLKEQPYCCLTGDYIGLPKNRYNKFKKRFKSGAYQMEGYSTALAEESQYEFEWKTAEDLTEDDVLVFPIRDAAGVSVSSGLARLLGLFAAEGNFAWYKDDPIEIQFHFSIEEKNSLADETYRLLKEVFSYGNEPRIYERPDRSGCEVRLSGKQIAQWFYDHCGSGALEKKLSRKVFEWDKESVLSFIGGWIAGDGTRRRITDKRSNTTIDNYVGYTSSEQMAHQMKYLSRLHGLRANVYEIDPRKIGFKDRDAKSDIHPSYHVAYSSWDSQELSSYVCADKRHEKTSSRNRNFDRANNYLIFPINSIEKKFYDLPVYNLEVEEDNSFIVEGAAVHNCQVSYSICSICHKKAHTSDEFCSHVKERKNKKFSGKMKCRYHESDCKPTDDCPVCGCKKGSANENIYKDAKIFEHNFDIKFIEDSFVVNPACHDCLVCDVLNIQAVQSKVANMMGVLKSAASSMESKFGAMPDGLEKTAGQQEIMDLNEAMNKLERVARSMMAQKQKIQLEYVSDIVESLADIQSITDELVKMGYAQLPSPTEDEVAFGTQAPASPAGNQAQQTQPQNMPNPQPAPAPTGSPQASSMGGQLGTVTKPSFSASASVSEKEFFKLIPNLKGRIGKIATNLRNFKDTIERRSDLVSKNEAACQAVSGDYRVLVSKGEDGEIHVAEYKGETLLRLSHSDALGSELQAMLIDNIQKVADTVLEQLTKESGYNMASQEKTAAGIGVDKGQIEVTTEAQLRDNKTPIAGRQENPPEGITESKEQLGGSEKINDTTSESPQVRRGTYETITEDQLASITDGYMVRWSDYPEVITEGQWDETSRAVRAILPDDWIESIGQAQLISLRDSHSWVDPNFITERQLAEQKSVLPNDHTARFAKASDPKALLKAAMSSVADAIAKYSLTPHQISQAVARMTANPHSQIKAARLALLNAIPRMLEARTAECKRRNYFSKIASEKVASFKPIDGVLAAMGDNVGYIKADDLVDAVRFVVADSNIMKRAEQEAHVKIASRSEETEIVVDRASALRKAFAELDRSDDGIYKICGSIKEDLGVGTDDKNKFMTAVDKFARSQVTAETTLTDVDVDVEAGTFEAIVKEASALSEEEKTAQAEAKTAGCPAWLRDRKGCEEEDEIPAENKVARSEARQSLVKEAQMMGGQMGGGMGGGAPGGMGGGGGQGATMPAPPGGDVPPVESFSEEGAGLPGEEDDGGNESKPPGSTCPACASDDVDVADGKSHCNNCGLDYIVKVNIESLNGWPGFIDDGEGAEEAGPGEDKGLAGDEGASGEGFAMPEQEPASIPVAAMTRLTNKALQKMAEAGIKIGEVSPITGTRNTLKISENEFLCLGTGNKYSVHLRSGKGKDKSIYAEWRWMDKRANRECPSCYRQKAAFVKALAGLGLTEAQFDAAQAMDKAKIVLSMQQKGLLKEIKTAGKNGSVISDMKTAFAVPTDKFPIESCREKLARRYGENAIALSGPCEGTNLADCVCDSLKTAGFYSDGLAIKIASIWSDQDGTVECWEDYVRSGLTAKQAATVCEQMRRKYSQIEHLLADEITVAQSMTEYLGGAGGGMPPSGGAGMAPSGGMGGGMGGEPPADDLSDPAVDPFASDMGGDVPGGDVPGDIGAPDVGGPDAGAPVDAAPPTGDVPGGDMGGEIGGAGGDLGGNVGGAPVDLPLGILDALKNLNEAVINEIQGKAGIGGAGLGGEGVDPGLPAAAVDIPGGVASDELGGEPAAVAVEMSGSGDVGDIGKSVGDAAETAVDAVEDAVSEEPVTDEGGDTGESADSKPEFGGDSDSGEEKSDKGGNPFADKGSDEGDSEEHLDKESKEDHVMAESEAQRLVEAEAMRKGRIVGAHKVSFDVSGILKVLNKKADQTALVQRNAQDDPDIGTISNGGTIGHEDKFKAEKPDVPHKGAAATMGHESKDLHPGDARPTVFTGDGEMGHEKEQGYTAEKTNQHTGGELGAGSSKAASALPKSTKTIVAGLADRITKNLKTAGEKKLDKAEPVSEDKDPGQHSNNKDLSTTPEGDKITPFADGDKKQVENVPERGEGSFMGHEKDTIKFVPKPENSAPQIPAGGGKNPKYDTKWDAEKQTKVKGTVIAQGDEKSMAERKEAATKLAGRMIERGFIKPEQLLAKIAELERYETPQISDLEKAMFAGVAPKQPKKGLDAVSNGSDKAVVIADTSKFRSGEDELKSKIQSLFKLQQQIDFADSDPEIQVKRNAR